MIFPPAQTWCGQMHANTGYGGSAGELQRKTTIDFAGASVIVASSAPWRDFADVYLLSGHHTADRRRTPSIDPSNCTRRLTC